MTDLSVWDGGPPQVCLRICGELARRGHEVELYTTDYDVRLARGGPSPLSQLTDFKIKRFSFNAIPGFALSLPLAAALRADVAKFDLVHIHSLYNFCSSSAAYYCRANAVPYLIRPHGTLDPVVHNRNPIRKAIFERLLERRNLERAAAVHFTSVTERDHALELGFNIKSVVIPLGVSRAEFAVERPSGLFRARWPETIGKRIILHLGRINFKKGLDLLVPAFAEIVQRERDVHLVIAGPEGDGYSQQVRDWVAQAGLIENVTFTGFLGGEDKHQVLRDADVFVLPSYGENFGLSVVEAMAAGLPVVLSDRVDICHEVAEANAGIVVECRVEPLINALQQLLYDGPLRRAMGERGRSLVARRFTWDSVTSQLEDVYEEILLRSTRAAQTN